MKIRSTAFALFVIIATGALMNSCQKFEDIPPYFEPIEEIKPNPSRRILVIAVDGLGGSLTKEAKPTNIMKMLEHSKYSWNALADAITKSATVWKTLTSGVTFSKHAIKDSNFVADVDHEETEGKQIKSYPSMLNLLLTSEQPDIRQTVISQWDNIFRYALPESEEQVLVTSDLAVKDSMVKRLQDSTYKNQLIIVNFSDLTKAGLEYGFDPANPEFSEALTKTDGYIGDLITALESRPQYNKSEEWLVVLTGTHGGEGDSFGGSSDEEKQVLLAFYNEGFTQLEYTSDGVYNSILFGEGSPKQESVFATVSGSEFDFGTTGEYSVQFKYLSTDAKNYPVFFSKIENGLGNPGWAIFTNNSGRWNLQIGGRRYQPGSPNVHDGEWHTCTFVLYDSASKRWVKRFTDDQRIDDGDGGRELTGRDITSPAPFTLGYGGDPSQGSVESKFADVVFFNTALTDEEIVDNLCNQDILNTHPKKENIYAYWPLNDGIGNLLANRIDGDKALTVENAYSWYPTEFPCSVPQAPLPTGVELKVVQLVDIATHIMYWFGVDAKGSWSLDGNVYLNNFELEFLNQD